MYKIDLTELEPVEIYKLLLRRDIKKFPNGFWQRPDALSNATKIIKFLVENILEWNDENIKDDFSCEIMRKYKLASCRNYVFDGSASRAIMETYPNKFKPWELKATPRNYWNKDTSVLAIKWMVEEKFKWTDDELKKNLSVQVFKDLGIVHSLYCFKYSPFMAINYIYPNKFKPWEFNQVPSNYWNEKTATDAVRWLIEEKLRLTPSDIVKLKVSDFVKYGLDTAVARYFKGNVFQIINSLYPNQYNPWDFIKVSDYYWNTDTARAAVKWLIEDKLKWNEEDIKHKFSRDTLKNNKLITPLIKVFDNSCFKILDNAYPGRFKKKDLDMYNPVLRFKR